MTSGALYSILGFLFVASTIHNVLTGMRMRRIGRQVFGESPCAARRRRRQQSASGVVDEEQTQEWHVKIEQIRQRTPSLIISITDVVFATLFLGLYILTTLMAQQEAKVELGVAYASIGALVAR